MHQKFVWRPFVCCLIFFACGSDGRTSSEEPPLPLRELPDAVLLEPADPAAAMPSALLAGGGGRPLTDALDGGEIKIVLDQHGRPWGKPGARALRTPRKLADTEFFIVLRPHHGDSPVQGLLARNHRAWDDFIQISHSPGGPFHVQAECQRGKSMRTSLAADKAPEADAPWLVHLRPSNDGHLHLSLNDQPAGRIRSAINARVFGRGYATSPPFRGQLGEIIAYEPLGEGRALLVKSLLASYWMLPGGVEEAFAEGFLEAPAVLGEDVTVAHSGPLTVRLTAPAVTPVYLGSSAESPPTIDDLPAGATVRHGTRWRLHAAGDDAPEGHFIFAASRTLGADMLGGHGFHALFHRAEGGDWREVAAAVPNAAGDIVFPALPLRSGEYQLAVIQGVPMRRSSARLVVLGAEDGGLVPGSRVRITTSESMPGQQLTLRETAGGTVIYQGAARELDLPLWVLRNMKIQLSGVFDAAPGVLASSDELELATPPDSVEYHPGLLATLIRDPQDDGLPPAAAFEPPVADPPMFLDDPYQGYPVLRDAESVRAARPARPGRGRFTPPSRHHLPIPSLTIATGERIAEWGALVKYPFDDFTGARHVGLRIEGVLLVDEPGLYGFQLESNLPATLSRQGAARVTRCWHAGSCGSHRPRKPSRRCRPAASPIGSTRYAAERLPRSPAISHPAGSADPSLVTLDAPPNSWKWMTARYLWLISSRGWRRSQP